MFIAETRLPTRHGTFRLRGYKHSIDGGKTFVEPTAIVSGMVRPGLHSAPPAAAPPRTAHPACLASLQHPVQPPPPCAQSHPTPPPPINPPL